MTGFGNKTVLQLLTYLHTTFGSISEKELEQNTARMQLQWNPPTFIEALFLQFKNDVYFATAGQDAPTKPTVLRWAYNIIEKTGRFDIACREWRHMDPNTKDWSLFKRHFKAADKDLWCLNTTGTAGFHGSVHSVHTTNTLLAATRAALAASELALARALAQVSLSSASTIASAINISATTPATSVEHPRGYCWTHGHTTNSSHTIATCNHPGEGHQATATASNVMGGNTDNFVPRFQMLQQ
jgi:hypothetical protein